MDRSSWIHGPVFPQWCLEFGYLHRTLSVTEYDRIVYLRSYIAGYLRPSEHESIDIPFFTLSNP